MAPVRSSGVQSKRYHVLCPICLDVFTDPITTPCGHNYCKACITTYWDNDWVCQCPLCTKLFPTRPDVSVNTLISEMADQYRRSQRQHERHATAKPGEVSCDVCAADAPATRLKALKTCLVCLTSFCEAHLERHQSVAALRRHKLVEPVRNLEDVLCRRHDRPLELFCRTDRAAVCPACADEQDHERHELVSLEEECEGKRAELRRTEADVQRAIQEKQVNIRELNCSVEQAEGFIAELRTEISELKERSSRLKQLSCTEDHLHLLQNFTSIVNAPPPPPSPPPPLPPPSNAKGLPRAKVNEERFSYDVATVRTAVAQLEKTVRREIEKLRGAELRRNMELWS